jgi:putative transposase
VLNEIVGRKPRWGFWKLYDRLRLDGQCINHKRLHRVYCAMKLGEPSGVCRHASANPWQLLQALTRSGRWTSWPMRSTAGEPSVRSI